MKGLIKVAAAALCCAAAAGGSGCFMYRDIVDPCYPERYNYIARKEVVASYTPQINNGHVLDQTIWNYDFEFASDVLTGGGLQHLAALARRRPQPDCTVYLQTAGDVVYDPAKPDEMVDKRQDLDARRVNAIQKFLTAQTAGRRGEFQVLVHDPSEVGIDGQYGARESALILGRAVGGLPTGGGGAAPAPTP